MYEEDGGGAAPANAAGSGSIAGLGVTPAGKPANWGEPPVSKQAQRKHKYRILRRAPPQALQEIKVKTPQAVSSDNPEENAIRNLDLKKLKSTLKEKMKALSPEERLVLHHKFNNGLNSRQIADKMNMSVGVVERRQSKALNKLRFHRELRQHMEEECGCMKGKFAGEETFIVPANTFFSAREARKKGKHWTKYIGEDTVGQEIREYYRTTKGKKPIILQCERTGAMCYAHYGKKK